MSVLESSLGESLLREDNDNGEPDLDARHRGTPTRHRGRWAVLAIFCLLSAVNAMLWISISSVSTTAKYYYRVKYDKIDTLPLVFYIIYVPTVVPSIWIQRRYGLRNAMLVAAATLAAGALIRLAARSPSPSGFNWLIFGNSIVSLSTPFIFMVTTDLTNIWFASDERAQATSIAVALNQLGMLCGVLWPPLYVPALTSEASASSPALRRATGDALQTIAATQAGLAVAGLILTALIFRDAPPVTARQRAGELQQPAVGTGARVGSRGTSCSSSSSTSRSNSTSAASAAVGCAKHDMPARDNEQDSALEMSLQASFISALSNDRASSALVEAAAEVEASDQAAGGAEAGSEDGLREVLRMSLDALRAPGMGALVLIFALCVGAYWTMIALIPQALSTQLNTSSAQTSAANALLLGAGIPGMYLAGAYVDRTHNYERAINVCIAVVVPGVVVLALLLQYVHGSTAVTWIMVICAVLGFFFSALQPAILELAAEVTYPKPPFVSCSLVYLSSQFSGFAFIFISQKLTNPVTKVLNNAIWFYVACVVVSTAGYKLLFNGELKRLHAGDDASAGV